MHGVEIFQEDIAEEAPALVRGRLRAPAADGAGQAAGHAELARDFGHGFEVGAEGEDDAAGAGEAAQALALGAEAVGFSREGFLSPAPGIGLVGEVILGSEAGAPGQVVVGLDEVVVAEDWVGRLDPAEEVLHPPPQFALVLRHVAGDMDFGQGHAKFVREAPEAGQKNAAREEVVLPVCPLEHNGDVVLDQPPYDFHRIDRER